MGAAMMSPILCFLWQNRAQDRGLGIPVAPLHLIRTLLTYDLQIVLKRYNLYMNAYYLLRRMELFNFFNFFILFICLSQLSAHVVAL